MKFWFKLVVAFGLVSAGAQGISEDYGWIESDSPSLLEAPPTIKSGRGKVRLLYKDWEDATGYVYIPRDQIAPDCVGQATAAGLDFRMAVQAIEGPHQVPQYETDASSIYGLSRIEIGNTKWSTGSKVGWAMRAVSEYGLLYRKNYLYAGYDLTRYNPGFSRTWGRSGLPEVLEEVAKLTPVLEYYQVSNYQEVRDAIASGYPVVVGSNVGFGQRTLFSFGRTKSFRDKDGFLVARGTWKHAMCFCGVDDRSRRKSVCCINSWGGSWVSGPVRLSQPPGSFWIDARTVTKMAQQNDAYAIVYVKSPLNYRLKP